MTLYGKAKINNNYKWILFTNLEISPSLMLQNKYYDKERVKCLKSTAHNLKKILHLLSLRCSARVCHCLCLLVVDGCASGLVRLICCRIIFTGSSPGSLLICLSLASLSPSLTTFAFRSSEVRRRLLDLDFYGGTGPLSNWYAPSFS